MPPVIRLSSTLRCNQACASVSPCHVTATRVYEQLSLPKLLPHRNRRLASAKPPPIAPMRNDPPVRARPRVRRARASMRSVMASWPRPPSTSKIEGEERRAEFEAIVAGLAQEYQPRTMTEHMMVQQLAGCYWRLAKVWTLRAPSRRGACERRANNRGIRGISRRLRKSRVHRVGSTR